MITAVDSNVLFDILTGDRVFGPGSLRAVRQCRQEGALVACEVVWAEVASGYASADAAREAISTLDLSFISMGSDAALAAGEAHREYRRRGGSRARVVAGFLIGAHARFYAERLLTRDRGFYRSYFQDLAVLDPTDP